MLSVTSHRRRFSSTTTPNEQTPSTPYCRAFPQAKRAESLLGLRLERSRGNLSSLAAACRCIRMARKVGKGRLDEGVGKRMGPVCKDLVSLSRRRGRRDSSPSAAVPLPSERSAPKGTSRPTTQDWPVQSRVPLSSSRDSGPVGAPPPRRDARLSPFPSPPLVRPLSPRRAVGVLKFPPNDSNKRRASGAPPLRLEDKRTAVDVGADEGDVVFVYCPARNDGGLLGD